MARIGGVDLPNNKRTEIALRYIYGIGPTLATKILKNTNIDPNIRAKDITEEQTSKINKEIVELNIPTEGELKRIVHQNIRRLQEIKCFRGARHKNGLPVRGQRTRSNARTRKGKRKTVGGIRKKAAAKT